MIYHVTLACERHTVTRRREGVNLKKSMVSRRLAVGVAGPPSESESDAGSPSKRSRGLAAVQVPPRHSPCRPSHGHGSGFQDVPNQFSAAMGPSRLRLTRTIEPPSP
jgi:hypothetical protein